MKSTIKIIFLFSCFLSLFSAFAQSPEKMSYQAIIRTTSNTLITNQSVGMRVSILQGSATGTEVYKELFNPNPQTNINGLVTVEIGSGIPLTGTFAGINWANGPFFIKTETDPTGGTSYTIVGTSQLLSSPYALYAKKSGDAGWGLSGNANTNSNTNFIGTTDDQDVVFKRNNQFSGRIEVINTSMGYNAFIANTTGYNNTAFGSNTMRDNTEGYWNNAFGYQALTSNTSGFSNTAFGYQALFNNTTGYVNMAIGHKSMVNTTTGIDNLALGNFALETNINGNRNMALGHQALYNTVSGYNNIGIGFGALVPSANGSNQIRMGNTQATYAGIQVAWSVTSDRRWKENIQPSILGLKFINDLKPVSYTRKNDETKKVEYGIIAQELETSLNKFGANTDGIITKDDDGMYSVRYNDLLAPMIKAIQEQQIMIEELKAEIQILKNKK